MASKTTYQCAICGTTTTKWFGRCPQCGEWNSIEEVAVKPADTKKQKRSRVIVGGELYRLDQISLTSEFRYKTGNGELDRVFGGGVVKGSVTLIGGEPGIGKSTILLQICEYLGGENKILYVSGEESINQIKLRADRLGVKSNGLLIMSETDLDAVVDVIEKEAPQILIIDSIQTMQNGELNAIPGSITQIKECAIRLIGVSKSNEITSFFVGHVNKDGAIAGPKILEHMVDTVLYFEGDKNIDYRLLRAEKNRYGSTNEIGMFEMTDSGLAEVPNPSALLLSDKPAGVPGSCAICVMEGTRPILTEVQALTSKTAYPAARRTVTGIDQYRVAMILAILEKRLMMNVAACDVFVNIVGGLRIFEPSCDLATAIALASSFRDKPVADGLLAIGEIGLAGEIRAVRGVEQRINEAARLGYNKIIVPKNNKPKKKVPGCEILTVSNVGQAIAIALDK